MFKLPARTEGYVLLAVAVLLLWAGTHWRPSLPVHHKLLVAKPDRTDGVFDHAVIFIVNHDVLGAFGIILNKPFGGPVERHKVFALHSTDVALPGSVLMKDVNLAMLGGASAVDRLKAADVKPAWYLVANGYAGWGPLQLDRELRRGQWKVIDYDPALVMTADPEKMWKTASGRPERGK